MNTGAYQPGMDALMNALEERYGIIVPTDRLNGARPILREILQKCRKDQNGRLEFEVQDDDQILAELVNRVTIAETYFFRIPQQFDFIEREVIPNLLALKVDAGKLKVWSAGCASGEEAYSIAMLLSRQGLLGRSEIHATDISTESLAKAASATYGKWSLRDQGWTRAQHYVCGDNTRFQVRGAIRNSVNFRAHNLAKPEKGSYHPPFIEMDLILCRNVLIYLAPRTVE